MKKNENLSGNIIFNQLLEDILSGRIFPGEKLLESELAKRFHVSRTPVREALLQLQKTRFVEHRPHAGCAVRKISAQEMEEVFDIICLLEGYAVEIAAAGNITEKDLSYLRSLQEELEAYFESMKYYQYKKKNLEFHTFFVNKCGNETLSEIFISLRQKLYLMNEHMTLGPQHTDYIKDHRKLLKAISEGKSLQAGKIMRRHIKKTKESFLEGLKRLKLVGIFRSI